MFLYITRENLSTVVTIISKIIRDTDIVVIFDERTFPGTE